MYLPTTATHVLNAASLRWWRIFATVCFPAHFIVTALTMGLRAEHYVLDGVFLLFSWLPGRMADLAKRCFPLYMTAVAYDNGRYLKRFRGKIHVGDLYSKELRWFGVNTADGRVTLPEWFAKHTTPALDFVTGAAYILYLYETVGMGIYLYFVSPEQMSQLAWGFLLSNVMGLVTYVIYPAAPPWYVMQYGTGPAQLDAKPSAAGAARFDKLLGVSYFKQFYARNPNVFGAMPSLHVAYPVLCFCVTRVRGLIWAIPTGLFALLVAFSALYLQHHYVLDVVAGALYAVLAYLATVCYQHRGRMLTAFSGL